MIITLLAEPRSGSTNLANWFYYNEKFTTIFLPSDIKSEWFREEKNLKKYIYKTEHLLIKEDFYHYKNYDEFLNSSDKVIYLFRENEKEQIDSWINAVITNNWYGPWVKRIENNEKEESFFKELKNSFKEKYLNENNFIISYEELYYRNGINKIIDYLNIESLRDRKFPFGNKYRIDNVGPKKIL